MVLLYYTKMRRYALPEIYGRCFTLRKVVIGIAFVLLFLVMIMLNFAPDTLSLLIIILMGLIAAVGYLIGLMPIAQFISGFHNARRNIERIMAVQSASVWLSVQQVDLFFRQKTLDGLFSEYVNKVNVQSTEGRVVSDLEEIINTDSLALRSWQSVMVQIPGTFTALGMLGTFIGLITGISTIGFSSVDAALSSIELLLTGIRTAFYTSIVGVVFSIVFNLIYRILWNSMVRELGIFLEDFHLHILPSVEEQERSLQYRFQQHVMERLDQLPKDRGLSMSAFGIESGDAGNEQRIMPEIRAGMKKGEFIFYIQPRYDLNTRKIIGGETLVRWNHSELGIVTPAVFLPVVERNGFIVQIDRYIWEEVCKTIRRWIDAGIRPLPLSLNVSKTDILAMDVGAYLVELVHKYHVPPRCLEVEIAQTAYLQCGAVTKDTETVLLQNGFRVSVDGFTGDFVSVGVPDQTEADALRLDLRNIPKNEPESISSIFAQAQRLKCTLVAQGIETPEQLALLRKCGCAEGQGYYLNKPQSVKDFETAVSEQ